MSNSPAARIEFLEKRVEAAEKKGGATSEVPFRQELIDLPRIQVPVAFPLYNLKSGRTHRAQSRYVEEHELPEDFFDDPESEDAQHAQHKILVALADEANLKTDLAEKEQQRPLVLTYDGFIVDGNRRTAALRDLGEVEELGAVVLPMDAEAQELYKTELELQMARDTKAPYNWVDQALHVRRGIFELAEDKEAIARRMNQDPEEIDAIIGRMTLVDLYLEWLGRPERYHLVGEKEKQSFEELWLRTRRNNYKALTLDHRRVVQGAVFAVIRDGGGYQDVRNVADFTIKGLADVTKGVREEELPPDVLELLDGDAGGADVDGSNDLLDELAEAEGSEEKPGGLALLNLVAGPVEGTVVSTVIANVAEDLREREREQKDLSKPLRRVKRALASLEGVKLNDETAQKEELARVLDDVIEVAGRVREDLEGLTASPAD